MKSLKLFILATLAVALGMAQPAAGQCTAGIGISIEAEFQGTSTQAAIAHLGDTVDYIVTVSLDPAMCPITDGEPFLTLPDGTVIDLDDNLSLSPGGSVVYDVTASPYTIVAGDLGQLPGADADEVRAKASVTAISQRDPPAGPQDVEAATNWDIEIINPCIEVTKVVDCDISKEGDEVIYHICVKNCSDPPIPLLNLTVVDDELGDLSYLFPPGLDPDEEVCIDYLYIIKGDDPDPLENTVTASAEDVVGYAVTATATDKVDLIHPKMTVSKTCETPEVPPGGEAEFLVTITNTGDADLEITTDDPEIPPFTLLTTDPVFTKIVKETHTGGDEVCNDIEVTWTLDPEKYCAMDNTGKETSGACCKISKPCIDVTKEVDCDISKEGDEVIYHICVKNCSEPPIPLLNLTVVDDELGDLSYLFPPGLDPDQEVCIDYPYVIKSDDPDPLVNVVTASAEDAIGTAVTKTATDKVDLIHPKMTVSKTCETPEVPPGGTAEFLITITNTGDADLEISTNDAEIPPFTLLTTDPPFTKTVTRTHTEGDEVCNEIKVTWTLPEKYCAMDNTGTETSGACCQVTGEEGCTPGFWKNNADKHDASAWCDKYNPGDDFSDIFGIPEQELRDKGKDVFTNPTLLEALGANGGGINALARHAVAALLNACSDCVDYPMSGAAIIAAVQDAVAKGEDAIEALHIKLAGYNEAGCPVNQDGECVGVEPDADG